MKKTLILISATIFILSLLLLGGCTMATSKENSVTQTPSTVPVKSAPIVKKIKITNSNWINELGVYNVSYNSALTSLPTKVNIDITNNVDNTGTFTALQPSNTPMYDYSIKVKNKIATITIKETIDPYNNIYAFNKSLNDKFFAILTSCMQATPLSSKYYARPISEKSSSGWGGVFKQVKGIEKSLGAN